MVEENGGILHNWKVKSPLAGMTETFLHPPHVLILHFIFLFKYKLLPLLLITTCSPHFHLSDAVALSPGCHVKSSRFNTLLEFMCESTMRYVSICDFFLTPTYFTISSPRLLSVPLGMSQSVSQSVNQKQVLL